MIRTKLITIGVVAALLAICSATQANQWEHQSSPWQEVPDPGWALNYLSYSKIRTCLISTAYVNSLNRYQDLTLYQYSGEINIENFFQAHF